MGEQQGVREGPDATRHRRDRGGHPPRRFEVDVADERPVDHIDPDVDHDGAAPEHLAANQARMADRDDHDLRVLHVAGEIACPRVSDRDRRVLADQEERRRHADDRGPAHDDGPFALDLDPRPTKDLDGGVGRRRQEAVVAEAESLLRRRILR